MKGVLRGVLRGVFRGYKGRLEGVQKGGLHATLQVLQEHPQNPVALANLARIHRQARRTAGLLRQGAIPEQPGALAQLALGQAVFPTNEPARSHRALHAPSPQELQRLAASADARHRRRVGPTKPKPRARPACPKPKVKQLSPKRRARPAPLQQSDIGLFDDPIEVDDSQPT
eukprot:2827019-Amphidinium_carterae.1